MSQLHQAEHRNHFKSGDLEGHLNLYFIIIFWSQIADFNAKNLELRNAVWALAV